MSNWLLDRLFDAGNQAEPRFAFQGTVNWMRALSEIIDNGACSSDELEFLYQKVQRRSVNRDADTLVFENMHMAYHNLASLKAMNDDAIDKYDICRSAIVSWYYSIYFAASAMVAASSGSIQETHALTAKVWQADIVEKKLIPYPFDLYLSSLVTSKAEDEISVYRRDNDYNLNDYANDPEVAHGAIVSYLKGTHSYKKWEAEKKIKSSKAFKALNVENFRKKVAQELRDTTLDKGQVNFLIQAFRYRGKANYRDSIFLSYGENHQNTIEKFVNDLNNVSVGFIRAASHYCSVRVEKGTWELFVDDIRINTRLSLDVETIAV